MNEETDSSSSPSHLPSMAVWEPLSGWKERFGTHSRIVPSPPTKSNILTLSASDRFAYLLWLLGCFTLVTLIRAAPFRLPTEDRQMRRVSSLWLRPVMRIYCSFFPRAFLLGPICSLEPIETSSSRFPDSEVCELVPRHAFLSHLYRKRQRSTIFCTILYGKVCFQTAVPRWP